jgi:hypothetical protein
MTPTEALHEMTHNSDYFFKYYPVKMFGGPGPWVPDVVNLKGYHLRREPELRGIRSGRLITKAGHRGGATRPGKIFSCRTHNISSFQMRPGGPPAIGGAVLAADNSVLVQTCGVPMVNFNAGAYGGVNLNGAIGAMNYFEAGAGADYMTTGQLTGCCFAWCEVAGNLRCVHILPHGNLPTGVAVTGATLQPHITANGHFLGMPTTALETFGALQYGTRYASVIGVRAVGGWRLYAQISTNAFLTIDEAWQIHPGAPRAL